MKPIKLLDREFIKSQLVYRDGDIYNHYGEPLRTGTSVQYRIVGIPTFGWFYLHNVIWLLLNGECPSNMKVTFLNGDTMDTRIENLRLATPAQINSVCRLYKSSTTGYRGVTIHGKRFRASITHDGVMNYLGIYTTIPAAVRAYQKAQRKIHGKFMQGRLDAQR